MANETQLTIIGNLTAAPELRFTNSGVPVASFTRTFDKQSGEWRDGEALFMRCSAWRDLAENVAESLTKGARVIVQGRLQQRSYTDKEGNQRTGIDLQADEVGASLRYHTATLTRANKQQGGWQSDNYQGGSFTNEPAPF